MHGNKYYNGNIAVQTWTYGNQLNGYICQYDQLNRYKGAYVILNNAMMDYYYTESFTYDLQGNIKTLERWDQQDMMNDLHFTYNGNQITEITDNGFQPFVYSSKRYHDNSNTDNDFGYDANGNMIYDKDRGISSIRYNVLNLPDTINFENGNRIIHRYTASGKKLTTLYHTYIAHLLSPISKNQPTKLQYGTTGTHYIGNIEYLINSDHYMRVNNPEGCVLYLSASDPHLVLTTSDHLGNIRESWVYSLDEPISEGLLQRTQYYPSGLPWNLCTETNFYPYRYNGKEFVEMHGLDEYDSEARWYYPAIMRTTTMDPLCEEYPDISPYAWCGNNPMNNVDPTGMDWYKNDSTQYITWFNEKKDYTGYTYLGEAGSVLGEFEPMIDDILQRKNIGSLYDDGFTFDIVSTNKGALLGSTIKQMGFLGEFMFNKGPEFSVFLEGHPYTQQMMNDAKVLWGQNQVLTGESKVAGKITDVRRNWKVTDIFRQDNRKIAPQFIGSYVYDAAISTDGLFFNNVIYDNKNVRSLFLHIPNDSMNKRRSEYKKGFGNTYQFYIWKSPIK